MKTKILSALFLLIFIFSALGCESFNRKFVRKNAEPAGPPQIFHVEPFVPPPNADVYKHAFLFWGTWEEQLIIALSPAGYPRTVNYLKVRECLQNAVSNLNDMKECLNDKKAQELDSYLKQLQRLGDRVDKDYVSDNVLSRMRDDVQTHKRNVDIRFSFKAIKNDIKNDSSRP